MVWDGRSDLRCIDSKGYRHDRPRSGHAGIENAGGRGSAVALIQAVLDYLRGGVDRIQAFGLGNAAMEHGILPCRVAGNVNAVGERGFVLLGIRPDFSFGNRDILRRCD